MAIFAMACGALAVGAGAGVVVVYNKNLPESKKLAEYYAEKRGVPRSQLFGADVLGNADSISRPEFRSFSTVSVSRGS